MTTSCQKLAQMYAADTKNPIPSSDASTQAKSDWLLTQEWGCILPGETVFHSNDDGFCTTNNNPEAPPVNTSTALVRPPALNYLKEDGFLHWVNQRGMQCVNRVVGNFYGFNYSTGSANIPSVSVSPPDSQCWASCFQATSESAMCFECVKQVVQTDPSRCPGIDPNLIQDAVNCQQCIGTSQGATPNVNDMWKCITGSIHPGLSTADIAIIVVVCVFVVTMIIVIAVYYTVIHPKILKKERERQQILSAGYSPDEL